LKIGWSRAGTGVAMVSRMKFLLRKAHGAYIRVDHGA
jgi:hypothetical protein